MLRTLLRNTRTSPAALALLIGLMAAAACPADVIYTNLGTNNAFDADAGLVISSDTDQSPSFAFTPLTDYLVTQIDFAASLSSEGATNEVTVSLESDNSGVPGDVLATMTFDNQMGVGGSLTNPPTLLTWAVSSSSSVVIDAGNQYWITFDGPVPGADTWNYNVTGAYGDDYYDGSEWVATQSTIGALDIEGEVVPEPGTFCLLAGVLAAGFVCRRLLTPAPESR